MSKRICTDDTNLKVADIRKQKTKICYRMHLLIGRD